MQKKIIALAVAGLVAAPAFAQSNVTVYGSFDAGVRNVTNVNANGDSILKMGDPGNYNSNRFGFMGTEDMGGGLKARFALEGDFNSGTGSQALAGGLFRRAAWVGLQGSMGTLDLGRQYTVIFKTIGTYDPFNYKYTGIIPTAGMDGARRDNDIQWANTWGSVTARFSRALGEVPGDNAKGATTEGGLSYANGPINFGGAYGSQKATTGLTTTNWTIGGAYTAGPMRLAVGYDLKDADVAGASSTETKNWWLGGSYSISAPVALSVAYYDTKIDAAAAAADAESKLFIVGLTYAFSKRTNFYADYDRKSLSGAARIGTKDTQNGISFGINHLF